MTSEVGWQALKLARRRPGIVFRILQWFLSFISLHFSLRQWGSQPLNRACLYLNRGTVFNNGLPPRIKTPFSRDPRPLFTVTSRWASSAQTGTTFVEPFRAFHRSAGRPPHGRASREAWYGGVFVLSCCLAAVASHHFTI
jgi:hypothetical protein